MRSLVTLRTFLHRRRHRRWVALAAFVVALFLAFSLGGTAVLAVLDRTYGAVPDPHGLPADSMVYDRSGRLIAELHPGGESRIPVKLGAVSQPMQDAIVAVEDRNFWSEGAVDVGRIAAAAWQDAVNRSADQGASTITEQLAKVLYLGAGQRSIDYKLREIFIARRLDETMDKSQILEAYLNDVSFGHGTTGAEAASRTYFGIPASQLDLPRASLLAGLPNAPATLDPFLHMDAAKARQRVVLQALVDSGKVTAAQANQALAAPITLASGDADNADVYPVVTQRVARELQTQLGVDPYRAGLAVTTTLDSHLQDVSQSAVTRQVSQLGALHVTDGALVAVDPPTGEMLAYVGSAGPHFPAWQIDMAASPRQPGSTFKLFTYSTALGERKVTMTTPIADEPLTLPTGGGPNGMSPYSVHNYDMTYNGVLPVKETFANSLNIPAVKVELLAGVPSVVQTARTMGVTTLTRAASSYGASLTLGTYAVPLWEMAQTGSVFAAGGVLHPAHLLKSARDADGHEMLTPATARQALDPGVAFIVNDILTNDDNRVLKFGEHSDLTVDGHLVAAKTGTTQDFRDNLTVGWNPHLAIATWVGNADDSPMRGTTGLTGAAPIWHEVMSHTIAGQGDDWPAPPSDVLGTPQGDYYLTGTSPDTGAAGDVTRSGECRFWTVGNARYWFCGSDGSDLPGDPGPGGGGSSIPLPPGQGHRHGH